MSDKKEKTVSDENGSKSTDEESSGTRRNRRRIFNLRNFLVASGLGTIGLVLTFLVIFTAFRTGYVSGYVEEQFMTAFDEMGVTMKTGRFDVSVMPFRLTFEDALFTNKKTGQKLVRIGNAALDMSLLDLFAMQTYRNVSIDRANINELDVWILFDKDGKSNYEGIEISPPKNVVRFQYDAANVSLNSGRVHFNEGSRNIAATARNVGLALTPDNDATANSEEISYLYEFNTTDSQFSYDKSELKPVDIKSNGRLHETGAEIALLELKTPVGTSTLSGKVNDWKRLQYEFKIASTVDLTRTSTIFPLGTSISGVGNFKGTVSGEGEKYKILGEVTSDSLAASNIRLKALKVLAAADGDGSMYKANGKAVAELLTFGDFRVDFPAMTGNIRGTGTDFKWFGELQAAALSSPLGTIGSLFISDGVAEYEDNRLIATLGNVRARDFTNDSVNLQSIQTQNIKIVSANGLTEALIPQITASNLKVEDTDLDGVTVNSAKVTNRGDDTRVDAGSLSVNEVRSGSTRVKNARASTVGVAVKNGNTDVTADRVEADEVMAGDSRTNGVTATGVTINDNGSRTQINSQNVRIAKVDAGSAVLANLNIAGVRLTVRNGVIEGQTNDFDAGDVDLKGNGRLSNVVAKNPVFVLEPSGRYRASLDMSLGGGVVGSVAIGAAKASVVADNDLVELNSLTAEVLEGKLDGNAKIALNTRRNSEFNADFLGLDLGKLLALQGGRVVPIEGKTNGTARLTFAGTNFRRASGTLNAEVEANAGTEERGLIPVSGRFGAIASDGVFDIDYASLQTEKSTLNADGAFDLNGDQSNLLLALNSRDASEIERIIRVLGVSPELEQQLDDFQISLRGTLAFNGTMTGNLSSPILDGRASLGSLVVRSKDIGTLVTNFNAAPDGIEITDGVLQARDGGSVDFNANIPTTGINNISVSATLNNINLANLMLLIPIDSIPAQLRDVQAATTGSLDLSGLPNDMRGSANLRAQGGTVNGQSFKNLVSDATFSGSLISITNFEAGFGNGNLTGKGFYRSDSTEFAANVSASSIPAEKILAFLPKTDSIPDIDGTITMTANAKGSGSNTSTYNVNFEGSGDNVSINKSRLGKIEFAGKTEDQVLTANAFTNLGGSRQPISARLDFSKSSLPFTAETVLDRTPVEPYIAMFRRHEPGSVVIGGSVTGFIKVSGDLSSVDAQGKSYFTTENITGLANLSQVGLEFDDTPLNSTEEVIVKFSTSAITFENAKFSGGGSNLVVTGTKAFTDEGINNLAIDGKINLGIVRAFSRNTLRNIFVNGIADVAIRLSGVNRTSRLNGTAIVQNGSAATFVGANRISFERLNAQIRFTTNQVQIEQVTAFLGGGRVTASGGALLNDALSLERVRLEIRGNNITVPLPDNFTTTGNADIEVNGRLSGNTFSTFVSGTVITRRSVYRNDIDLADLIGGRRDASLAQSIDDSSTGGINFTSPRLDIRIIGRDALVVRNNLADLTASADLRLEGDTDTPRLSGRITASRGTIFFRDDRYELQRGVLSFPPDTNIEPRINLQAETEKRGYQIFVNLSGNLSDTESLTAVVTSNPSLPQADIISLMTTGSLSNTTDGIPTLAQGGLNTAAEILTDEIINKPISRATDKLFGINRFELDPIVSGEKGNPGARLTVGRQINRNLLVTYATNLSQDQNQVLALEYRVSNRLSFVAAYEQKSLSNVTQNRNKFSFELRFRKRF